MTNAEAAFVILRWCDEHPDGHPFTWPTDRCGHQHHLRFILHKRKRFKGGTPDEFIQFVRGYAANLAKLEKEVEE